MAGRIIRNLREEVNRILRRMAETSAGSQGPARELRATVMTLEERQTAVDNEPAALRSAVNQLLI